MTPSELSAIRARLDAATPGPWEAGTADCCPDMGWVDGPKGAVCPQFTATKVTHSLDANDAELIANAPTDLRALLDEVERLTKREDDLVKAGLDLMVANKDLTAEVVELHADPLPAAAWVREVQQAAFRRGTEAMRTAAIAVASKRADLPKHSDLDSAWCRSAECILDELRNLPAPEDK